MIVDIKALYIIFIVIIFMIILCIMTIKKLLSIKSLFTTLLMTIEEIIGICAFAYIVSMVYKAMDNHNEFVQKYGRLEDNFTYISIYFCLSQIIILILASIYKFIKRRTKFIKKRRIIK